MIILETFLIEKRRNEVISLKREFQGKINVSCEKNECQWNWLKTKAPATFEEKKTHRNLTCCDPIPFLGIRTAIQFLVQFQRVTNTAKYFKCPANFNGSKIRGRWEGMISLWKKISLNISTSSWIIMFKIWNSLEKSWEEFSSKKYSLIVSIEISSLSMQEIRYYFSFFI